MSITPIGCIRLTGHFTTPGKAYREPQPHMVNGALPTPSRLCYADYATYARMAWRGPFALSPRVIPPPSLARECRVLS
jgi:hypothetical protein